MRFQKHETPVEKFIRTLKYVELREAGQSCERAHRFRDWTLAKVRQIVEGTAVPI